MISSVGMVSYGAGAALFLLLTALLLTSWRGRLQGGLLVAAAGFSAVWCGLLALHAAKAVPSPNVLAVAEVCRDSVWFAFLLGLLGFAREEAAQAAPTLRRVGILLMGLCAALAVLEMVSPFVQGGRFAAQVTVSASLFGQVLLAVIGLALTEHLFCNTRAEQRWAIKALCLGVGGLFAYDFFLYSHALLFQRIDVYLWNARGAVNAIAVPLIAVSAARNPDWSVKVFVSRHVVFHSAALLGAGIYLMAMAAAGYYIRIFGGTWGGVAQAVFLSGAVVLLLVLHTSSQLRSRARVFLSKHFFRSKYDYREEWLRFTHLLATSAANGGLADSVVGAMAGLMESPGGVLWLRGEEGDYRPVGGWQMRIPEGAGTPADASLVRFLAERGWVIRFDEYREAPERYRALELPSWSHDIPQAWLAVPLPQGDELLGFVVLLRSNTKRDFNFEDLDLLKTVGAQAASYLALRKTSEALAEARQFEAFTRLSSFVVHDLKNLVAQLSLVTKNASKHRRNPVFMDDALGTVENATAKMNRLLAQLRKDRLGDARSRLVNLKPVLEKAVEARRGQRPQATLEAVADGLIVNVDPDRLTAVLEHLVQNAQEATPPNGRVRLRALRDGDAAVVEIADTGYGMDQKFIHERLFRPFDTTKGNAGMGIGVFEARELVRAKGGEMSVESAPGKGTTVRLRFPLADEELAAAVVDRAAEMAL